MLSLPSAGLRLAKPELPLSLTMHLSLTQAILTKSRNIGSELYGLDRRSKRRFAIRLFLQRFDFVVVLLDRFETNQTSLPRPKLVGLN